jgi:hypothetical protein
MNDEQIDKLLTAFAVMSGAVVSIAKTLELTYQQQYPAKRPTKEATITYVPNKEQETIDSLQGDEDDRKSPIQSWTTLGSRESEWVRRREQEGEAGAGGPGRDR